MTWEDLKTVKKGNIGEELVNRFLESKGFVIYKPITNKPHAFDKLAVKNKEIFLIAEVKTKPKRLYYEDTGIDHRHYLEYKKVQEKCSIKIFIFFVDEHLHKIYGNYLNELEKESTIKDKKYPSLEKNIIYFSLKNMRPICNISEKESQDILEFKTGKYDYKTT